MMRSSLSPIQRLNDSLRRELLYVNEIIVEQTASFVPLVPKISLHLLQAGGKRIRPLLLLGSARLFGPIPETAFFLAAAIEFIHNATLLHDDVIDESPLRRGQSTAHTLWGIPETLLVGDFLFGRSFQLMSAYGDKEILTVLSQVLPRIAEGEVFHLLQCHSLEQSLEDMLTLMQCKTAELFSAACHVGALVAGQSAELAQKLRDFGHYFGLAFQIQDDILDYIGDAAVRGKAIGDDFREGKVTFPVLLTYPQLTSSEKEFLENAFLQKQAEGFEEACAILQRHNAFERAQSFALSLTQKAQESLNGLPEGEMKEIFLNMAGDGIT